MEERWARAMEPTLPEILADPAIRAVMARDKVRPADIEKLFAAIFDQPDVSGPTAERNGECGFSRDDEQRE